MKLSRHSPLILFGLLHAIRGKQDLQKLGCADCDICQREKDRNKAIFKRASELQVCSKRYKLHKFFFCDQLQEKCITAMCYVVLSRDQRKDGL